MKPVHSVLFATLHLTALAGAQAAPTTYQNAVLGDNPILYYQFNELTGDAINHGTLGTAFNATHNGTPTRGAVTSGGDTGVEFDSSDDFLESGAIAPASLTGNPSFTVETIVFVPAGGTATLWAPFLHWGESVGSEADKTMKSVYFSFSNNDPAETFAGFYHGGLQTQDPVALDQWHHIVWVRQGGGAANVGTTLFIDGVSVSLEDDPDLCCDGFTPNVTTTEFRVNRSRDFKRFFTGTMDELVLYDRALTEADVIQHFNALAAPGPAISLRSTIVMVLVLLVALTFVVLWRRRSSARSG